MALRLRVHQNQPSPSRVSQGSGSRSLGWAGASLGGARSMPRHSIRCPTSSSSAGSPPRTWGNSMLGAISFCLCFSCTHSSSSPALDPPRLSVLPLGTCQHGAAQKEGLADTQVPFSKGRRQVQGLPRAHSCEARAKRTQLTPDLHRFAYTEPPVHRCPFSINIGSALPTPGPHIPQVQTVFLICGWESTTQMQVSCVHL